MSAGPKTPDQGLPISLLIPSPPPLWCDCRFPHLRGSALHDNLPMTKTITPSAALSGGAFATLLLIALMMGANHVAARLAFNNGVDVATAVSFRSAITAAVVTLLLVLQRVPVKLTARHRRALPAIGLLVGVQSLCLYSAVARLPVALALLAFNTYPLWTALWARVFYGHRPEPRVLRAMPVILIGLALALDVLGAASGLGAAGQWGHIGAGVAFALTAAATFGLALVVTQHEAADVDGSLRTAISMAIVGVVALLAVAAQGGFALPRAAPRISPRQGRADQYAAKHTPLPHCPTKTLSPHADRRQPEVQGFTRT